MEVDEKPTEKYTDVGGLDNQIHELIEAIVWPMKEAERFKKIGIKAPKGTENPYLLTRWALLTRIDRRSDVRTTRDRQDTPCQSLCRPNRCDIPQTRRATTRSDVHRRRCEARS